jgi:hypothetical protein
MRQSEQDLTWAMGEKHALPRDAKMRQSEQDLTWVMGEKHALPSDEKARKSEQYKHGQWGKPRTS